VEQKNIFMRFATLGPIGHLPASATVASFFGLLLVLLFSFLQISDFLYGFICLATFFAGFSIIGRVLPFFKKRDPAEIVFDELIGCLFVFWCVPISFFSIAVGFLLFRFFDVVKPFGLKKTELLYGSLGVIMDDVLAGILANVLLRLILVYWWQV